MTLSAIGYQLSVTRMAALRAACWVRCARAGVTGPPNAAKHGAMRRVVQSTDSG